MSSDEETFVIIVGDDDYEIPDSVKDVVENSEITHLTSLDEIKTENVEIKEEPEDYFFKEEPVDDLDEEYVPKSETSSDDDYSDDDINNVNRSRRKKVKVITSYVQELREAYPELRNDRKMLINILSQIMKAMKPPPLPQDYFIMNGIMLECIECGKLSNGIPAAGRHYQEYHGERYLICFACGVDFRSPTNLYKHEKRCPAPDIGIVLKARARHIGNKARARPFLSYEKPKERTDDAEEVRVYRVREALRAEVGAAPARAPRPPPPAAAHSLPAVPKEISPNVITQAAYEEGAWHVTYD